MGLKQTNLLEQFIKAQGYNPENTLRNGCSLYGKVEAAVLGAFDDIDEENGDGPASDFIGDDRGTDSKDEDRELG